MIFKDLLSVEWGAENSVGIRGEWNVLGSGACHFQEQGWQCGGKVWLQLEPTHRMLGVGVTKVSWAMPHGGPACLEQGLPATHPEFP